MRLQYVKWLSCLTAVIVIITAVGCQRSPTTGKVGSMTESQNDSSNTAVDSLNEGSSLAELSSQTDSSTPASSNASPSSTAPGSSQDSPSSSVTSSYTFRADLEKQLDGIDENHIPECIYVVLDSAAYDPQKQYDESFFSGCDITIVRQGSYGGHTMDDDGNPLSIGTRYFMLKVNQSGLNAFYDVLQILDQREELSVISLEPIAILD